LKSVRVTKIFIVWFSSLILFYTIVLHFIYLHLRCLSPSCY